MARLRPSQLQLHNERDKESESERESEDQIPVKAVCQCLPWKEGQPDPLYGSIRTAPRAASARPGESDSTERGQIGEEGIRDKKKRSYSRIGNDGQME